MSQVNQNIRFLRKQKGLTQGELAEKIDVTRSVIGAYEENRAEPKLITMQRIANFFGVTIDQLVGEDLSKVVETSLQAQSREASLSRQDPSARKLRVLSITLDKDGRENIEMVPAKAAAGYLNGYADPEYLEELPRFQLPMFPQGTYRAFEITGDSMLPLASGTIIIGEYAESWSALRDGTPCIVVTSRDGIVFKRIYNRVQDSGQVMLHSDNALFPPYGVDPDEILEVWRAKAYIGMEFPDNEMTLQKLAGIVMDLQKEVIRLRK